MLELEEHLVRLPDNIKNNDIYSLILFVLYKMREEDEFSTLSELIYLLDRESMLKLCEYYGGLTITVPKIEDLEVIVYALLLYQQVDVEKKQYENVVKSFEISKATLHAVTDIYERLPELLKDYTFRERKNDSRNIV